MATRKARRSAGIPAPTTRSAPKTTRPSAGERRDPEPKVATAKRIKRKLDAAPDRVDIRDWIYRPSLQPLPDQIIHCRLVPAILDQGQEGACTGFAMAAVINFQLGLRNLVTARERDRLVSPRMIYEMARRYDEWPGEGYEGSSARGAMKGWVAHGVARQSLWPDELRGPQHLTDECARDAQRTPGGAYYRVMHRDIRDMHAALAEAGVLYATLMVHQGWDEPGEPGGVTVKVSHVVGGSTVTDEFPVIVRKGKADGGHAVAIVGYTAEGFIVQNSWGAEWGNSGFALLPYEDWLLHATDCWVAQLGVPVALDLWLEQRAAETTAGLQRAGRAIPLSEIRPYVIDVGNNGLLSDSGDYWTTEEDIERMLDSVARQAASWDARRIMLYVHGGLSGEAAAARRVVAFRDVCLRNRIYPIHVMWETGFSEALQASVLDIFTNEDERAGADWLKRMRDGLVEAKDRTVELTAAVPGGVLWREMKENARLASAPNGGLRILAQKAARLLKTLRAAERRKWELHVVGHSAGSIFAAHAIDLLGGLGMAFRSLQLMAPAIRADLFRDTVIPAVKGGLCPHPTLYLLSDVGERDDRVGPYGKSLLYLVSNAFEGERETPLAGMERFVRPIEGSADRVDPVLEAFFQQKVDGQPSLVVAGAHTGPDISPNASESDTHGGFDNDTKTMNAVLYRILGRRPDSPFTDRDLQFE
jgi:papain like protease